MKHLFIPYNLALIAKEKGFDEECLKLWEHVPSLWTNLINPSEYKSIVKERFISAPLYQQIIDWFREKHNIHIQIDLGKDETKNWYDFYLFKVDNTYDYDSILSSEEGLNSYYKALNAAIETALSLI